MKTSTTVYVSFEELCLCSQISEQQVVELIQEEVITPLSGASREEWQFSVAAISTANKAARIQSDLMVDWGDIPLVLSLLEEVDQLRSENERLMQRLNRFISEEPDH